MISDLKDLSYEQRLVKRSLEDKRTMANLNEVELSIKQEVKVI